MSPSRFVRNLICALLLAAAFSAVYDRMFPRHTLVVAALGTKNDASQGSEVWIKGLLADGSSLAWDRFNLSGKWERKNDRLLSHQDQPATLQWTGSVRESLRINFIQHPWSGQVQVFWDGSARPIDLYAPVDSDRWIDLVPGDVPYSPGRVGRIALLAIAGSIALMPFVLWGTSALSGCIHNIRSRGVLVSIRDASAGLLLCAGSLVLTAVVAELVIQRFYPQDHLTPLTSYVFRNDPYSDFSFLPNLDFHAREGDLAVHVTTNFMGLPDGEFAAEKPPGETRILIVGDSFTWGGYSGDVNDGYPRLLEGLLRPAHPRVRVINAGVPGYGLRNEVGTIKKLGSSLKPDIVVVGFFVGNDFVDNLGTTNSTVVNEYLINVRQRTALTPLWVALYKHSHIYRLINYWDPVTSRNTPYTEGTGITYFPEQQAIFDDAVAKTDVYLDDLVKELHRIGARPLVAIIPARAQLDPKEMESWKQKLNLNSSADPEKPTRAIRELLTAHQIQFVDLLDDFKRAADPALYVPNGHASRAGNLLIAEKIAAALPPF